MLGEDKVTGPQSDGISSGSGEINIGLSRVCVDEEAVGASGGNVVMGPGNGGVCDSKIFLALVKFALIRI